MSSFKVPVVLDYYTDIQSDSYHRYKSWEHCYLEFSRERDVDKLSLHLAFYLASWGMYRGSSGLLQKDYKIHYNAVKIILNPKYDSIRACDAYVSRQDIPLILTLIKELQDYYENVPFVRNKKPDKITATDTLISKIILGATGSIPAYDRYFNIGLQQYGITQKIGNKSLNQLFDFMEDGDNLSLIEKAQEEITSGELIYPKMKILDMFFWSEGFNKKK